VSCADAAKQGIKCRLTDAGPVEIPVTLETFKSALAQHGVSCSIAQIRMIGQETHLKRYVVEYRCADQPAGMIAYLPLEGNTTFVAGKTTGSYLTPALRSRASRAASDTRVHNGARS